MDKQAIIDELRRVAAKLRTAGLTKRQFKEHGQFSLSAVENSFGSWNQAVEAARLDANPSGPSPSLHQMKLSDDELLQEIIRLTRELGRKPP